MARHDPKRSGAATGTSDITEPVAYWRRYIGGTLASRSLAVENITGDGRGEVVMITGGRAIAKEPSDAVVWATPPLDLVSIAGVDDLDGDGARDLVAYSRDRVYIIAIATGAVLWVEPRGEMGTIGAVRIADLNEDGHADLLIQECTCCGVNSGHLGFAYSFAAGFDAPALLWELPVASCAGGRALTIADVNGAGGPEVFTADYDQFFVIDGVTGAQRAATAQLGTWIAASHCFPAQLDGTPGNEVVCLQNFGVAPATNQRRLFVLRYVAGPPPALEVVRSEILAPDAGGDVAFVDPVVDLDGGGSLEIVFSARDASSVWRTRVLDAASGSELGEITGEIVVGTAAIETLGRRLIITTSGTSLFAWAYDPLATPTLDLRWTIPDRDVLPYPDAEQAKVRAQASRLLQVDLDGDNVPELITRTRSSDGELIAYKATGAPTAIATYVFPETVVPLRAWLIPPVTEVYPQIAVASNDGFLTLLNASLQASSPGDDASTRGLRIGGYYAAGNWRDLQRTPVVASLDGGPEAVLVTDSRGALLRLDAAEASLASPPAIAWHRGHRSAPTVVPGLDGTAPGIACVAIAEPVTTPPLHRVEVLDADGVVLWGVPVEGTPFNDPVWGKLDGDSVPDLAVQWGYSGDTYLHTRALAGTNGSTLWDATPIDPGAGRQPAGITIGPWDGDALDDVHHVGAGAVRVLSGADGIEIGTSLGIGASYFMATLFDVNGDSVDEVTLHGGYHPIRTLTHDLQTELWINSEDERPYPYSAVARCSGLAVLAGGTLQHPARLRLTQISGPSPGATSAFVLAGGQLFATEAAADAAGVFQGHLTSAAVHSNLGGLAMPVALLGSTDGYLYGVDPCSGTLGFAVDFGVAVGHAVFGDTDDDGRDEIIVTAADGYLYGLKQKAIDAPAWVFDTDPDRGIVDTDVNSIETVSSLSATWAEVAGATRYEVAVVNADGELVTSPAWQDVTTATATTLSDLPLEPNGLYRFAVRAFGDSDPSVDAVSNGVIVVAPGSSADAGSGGADAGPGTGGDDSGGGCGCAHGTPSDESSTLLLMLPVAWLLGRRRDSTR